MKHSESPSPLDLDAYDFVLPAEAIAQSPREQRDQARMFVLSRSGEENQHRGVKELPEFLQPGDLLVVNTTRVLPARLRGRKSSGGQAEALLLEPLSASRAGADATKFRALVRCGGRMHVGQQFVFQMGENELEAELIARESEGVVVLNFAEGKSPYELGEMPLPPYIRRDQARPEDTERYQTVFARQQGSVAAPTAGLHFTPELFEALEARGVERAEVVLHVGPGTFRPVGQDQLDTGKLHSERFELPEATASAIERTRARGGRVIAVGTTTTRVLESQASADGCVTAGEGSTEIFIYPGIPFQVVDGLLTNFHLPKSSLLLLIAAFAGRERILSAYEEALSEGYRFYSYGDAMLIL
jgi:S-adenosylmethionine:tRNA ribosyltransferase-isomerase